MKSQPMKQTFVVSRFCSRPRTESFQLDQTGHRIFVNVPDEHEIAVLELTPNGFTQAMTWPVRVGEKNSPMALDSISGQLFIAWRKPLVLAQYHARTGQMQLFTPCVADLSATCVRKLLYSRNLVREQSCNFRHRLSARSVRAYPSR